MRPNNRREPRWVEPKLVFVGHTNELDAVSQSDSPSWPELLHDDTLTESDYQEFMKLAKKASLTMRQIQCIYGYYWKGKTIREIAKELEIAHQVAHKHIEYGKDKIYPILKAVIKSGKKLHR